ncbi:autotransporter domain-containing protein [Mesorhizobium australicum]|uniref:autotransporter domain-containing protein n=1 Tax=Mesorhizobium australicum TaxID=536018 RepID=UPI003334ABF8
MPVSLGLQLDTTIAVGGDQSLQAWGRAAWVHEFEPDRSVRPSFQAAPGYSFVVQGAAAAGGRGRRQRRPEDELEQQHQDVCHVRWQVRRRRADLWRQCRLQGELVGNGTREAKRLVQSPC